MNLDKRSSLVLTLFLNILIIFIAGLMGIFYNINLMFIIVSIVISVQIIYFESKKEKNVFNLVSVFTVFWFFYTNATLIDNYLDKQFLFSVSGKVYFLYYLALVSYYISYKLFRVPGAKKYTFNGKNIILTTIITAIIILAIQFYFIFIEFSLDRFIFTSKAARNLMVVNAPILYSISKQVLYLLSPLLYIMYLRSNDNLVKGFFVFILVYNVTVAFLIIDRSSLLVAILPTLFIMVMYKRISMKKLYLAAFIGFFVLVDFKSLMFNIINNGKLVNLNLSIPEEFYVSYSIATEIVLKLDISEYSYLFGRSYLDSFIATIFPFLNIEPLSVWYMRNYFPEIFSIGGGRAFSSVGEGYFNFGTIGVVAYYSLIGITAKYFNIKKNNNDLYLIIFAMLIPLTYKLFRSEFYSLLKTHFWFWFVPLVAIYVISKYFKK